MAYNFPQTYVLLATATASSSASISFTSVINANFSTYLVKIRNLLPATNGANFEILFSANNGSTYLNSGYQWGAQFLTTTPTTGAAGSTSATFARIADVLSNTSTLPSNYNMMLYDLNSGSLGASYLCESTLYSNTVPVPVQLRSIGSNSATGINAIQFLMSSGNIASGNFYIYGVSEP